MTLQEVTRKINDLVCPQNEERYYKEKQDPTLEDVLVALEKHTKDEFGFSRGMVYNFSNPLSDIQFDWQLTKPLSQQSKETIETITKILELFETNLTQE